ncbi:MAG: hypothetical protein K8T26_01795 [Lentisphaerae bacterium]|nr:hypothetical protein [Lentisphaerota bacterium]
MSRTDDTFDVRLPDRRGPAMAAPRPVAMGGVTAASGTPLPSAGGWPDPAPQSVEGE